MSTGKEYANFLENYRLLSKDDIGEKFLEYLKNLAQISLEKAWDNFPYVDTAITISSDAINTIKLTESSYIVPGGYTLLRLSEGVTYGDAYGFENTNGITYYVALKQTVIPNNIEVNPRNGVPMYGGWVEDFGKSTSPNSVIAGTSTLTFVVDSVTEVGVSNAGRKVLVYKNSLEKEATTQEIAIETCTVTWDGSNNRITTTARLGQTTPSTIASDYTVICLGPTISRNTDLSADSDYIFIGTVTGNGGTPTTFDTTGQKLIELTLSNLGQLLDGESNGKLKIHITTATNEDNVQQILVEDTDSKKTFSIDEKGLLNLFGFPVIRTTGSAKIHKNQWYDDTHIESTKPSRCITTGYINGHKKLFLFDSTTVFTGGALYVETWDLETATRDSITSLVGKVADSSDDTVPVSAFVDGDYVYVAYLPNSLAIQTVQAFNTTTWSVKSGWPSTGVTVTTQPAGNPDANDVGNLLLDYNSESFLMMIPYTNTPVSIVSKEDGAILDQGYGDAIDTTNYMPISMAVSGGNVFWIANHGTGNDARIFSASLSDLTTGSGLPDFPLACITGSIKFGKEFQICNGCFMASTETAEVFYMFNPNSGQERLIDITAESDKNFKLYHLTQDGANFWFSGSMRGWADGEFKPTLFRFNSMGLITPSTSDPSSMTDMDILADSLTPFLLRDNTDWGEDVGTNPTSFIFDGSDIFIVNPGPLEPGHVYRITNALFRHSSSKVTTTTKLSSEIVELLFSGKEITEVVSQVESEHHLSDSKNYINLGGDYDVRELHNAIISGSKKLLTIDTSVACKIHIVDCETMAYDTYIDNTDLFPGMDTTGTQDWELISICVDESTLYSLFRDNDASPKEYWLQAYDLGTWDVRTGWPTYGTLMGAEDLTPSDSKVRVANATISDTGKLYVIQPYIEVYTNADPGIVIIDKTDGTIDGSGAGDFAPLYGGGTYPSYIEYACSNGDGVYFVLRTYTDLFVWGWEFASMSITSPGTTGILTYGGERIRTSEGNSLLRGICVCGRSVLITTSDDQQATTGHEFLALDAYDGYVGKISSADNGWNILGQPCTDGIHFWCHARQHAYDYHLIGSAIFRCPIHNLGYYKPSPIYPTYEENLQLSLVGSYRTLTYFYSWYRTGMFEEDWTANELNQELISDGVDIWSIFHNDTGTNTYILRLTDALKR